MRGTSGIGKLVLMEASLLVLAGGLNRKAWLEVGDTILLRCVAQRLAPAFSEVLASFVVPEQLEQPVPYRVIFDRRVPGGPLAGLEAEQRLETKLCLQSRAISAAHTAGPLFP